MPDAIPNVLAGQRPRRRLTSVRVDVAAHHDAADAVRFRWDADTEILSASIVDRRGGGSVVTCVQLEGADGSWVTLELRAGRLCGVEIAVWPPVTLRPWLVPPHVAALVHATVPTAGAPFADMEVDTTLTAETDRLERTFASVSGRRAGRAPSASAAISWSRSTRPTQLAGLWLLNVPPAPLHS